MWQKCLPEYDIIYTKTVMIIYKKLLQQANIIIVGFTSTILLDCYYLPVIGINMRVNRENSLETIVKTPSSHTESTYYVLLN